MKASSALPSLVSLLAILFLALFPSRGSGESRWLPERGLHPLSVADPWAPRLGLALFPGEDRLDAALGASIPLVATSDGATRGAVVLEGGAFLRLGMDGSFYPLQTVDGLLGIRAEAARGPGRGALFLRHVSAHRADGDSTVRYRGETVSRETWALEAGAFAGPVFVYLRGGSSWHAVPEDRGLDLAFGGTWSSERGDWRPFAAVHFETDHDSEWTLFSSVYAGVETGGSSVVRFGLRGHRGPSPSGQYRERRESVLGVEIQFAPGAPG